MANFGLDRHSSLLQGVCRFCGNRLKKAHGQIYDDSHGCIKEADLIFNKIGLKIVFDDPACTPPRFCHKCYNNIKRERTLVYVENWPPHKRTGVCDICTHYERQMKGGRPKKPPRGRPKSNTKPMQQPVAVGLQTLQPAICFQPDPNLFQQLVVNTPSFRGDDTLQQEHFI